MTLKVFAFIVVIVLGTAMGDVRFANGQRQSDSKIDPEMNRRVQALLAETARQTQDLKNRNNRVQVYLALGELMWKDQEAEARRMYQQAFDVLREALKHDEPGDEESSVREDNFLNLRNQVLESLAKHDPQWARQLFPQVRLTPTDADNTNAPTDNDERSKNQVEEDRRFELSLLTANPGTDPAEVAKIYRKAIGDASSTEAVGLIEQLINKSPLAAREFAPELIAKVRKADLTNDSVAVELSVLLFEQSLSSLRGARNAPKSDDQTPTEVFMLNSTQAHEFINFIVDIALSDKPSQLREMMLMGLAYRQSELAELAPDVASRLKNRLGEINKEMGKTAPSGVDYQQLWEEKDPETIVKAAQAAPEQERDSLYKVAATVAWQGGDKVRAKEIMKNIKSASERSELSQQFQDMTFDELIEKQDFVHARELISQTRPLGTRVRRMISLAQAYAGADDKKTALEVLTEVQNQLPARARNSIDLELTSTLVNALASIDIDRGFALKTSQIEQVNELIQAAAKVANFDAMPASFSDNEFAIERSGNIPGFDRVVNDIQILAQTDFNRTKQTLDRFERPEIRVAAYLSLARTVLEPRDCSCSCPDPAAKKTISTPK